MSSQSAVRPDMLYTWIVVLVVGSITGSWGQEGPLVQTDKGPVRGTTETLNGKFIVLFSLKTTSFFFILRYLVKHAGYIIKYVFR